MMFHNALHTGRRNTALCVVGSLMLTSCVSAPISREARVGADDGSDVCRSYVVALDSTGNFFAEDMIQGAVMGAAAGGLAGGLATALSGGDIGKGALMGALAGGVAGAIGGYYKNRMQQGRDQAILAINQDLNKELGELDQTDKAIKSLVSCRAKQRDKIRADYAAKRINKSQAQTQWTELKEQVQRDQELMRMVTENIGKRQDEYKYANDQMVAEFDSSKLTDSERKQAKSRIATNNKNIDKEYNDEVSSIRKEYSQRKKEKNSAASTLEQEEKARLASAKKAAETKKEANEKTGGNQQVVATASSFSASQSKKESIAATSSNYSSNMGMDDSSGFEKATGLQFKYAPHTLTLSGSCTLPGAGETLSVSDADWGSWFSLDAFGLARTAA